MFPDLCFSLPKLIFFGLGSSMAFAAVQSADAPDRAKVELPIGFWEGHGTFVEYLQKKPEGSKELPDAESLTRDYPTSLRISKRTDAPGNVYQIDIRSQRGKTRAIDDDETRIIAFLRERETIGANTVYELLDWRYRSDTTELNEDHLSPEWVMATATRADDAIVLQLHYGLSEPGETEPGIFKDTFIFRGRELIKSGSYASASKDPSNENARETTQGKPSTVEHLNAIYWVEKLRLTETGKAEG